VSTTTTKGNAVNLRVLACILAATAVPAAQHFPAPDWKDSTNPIAAPDAVPGGEMTVFGGQYPKSLNYYLENSVYVAEVFGAMYETLLSRNPVTLEDEPRLTESWSISGDKRAFTFKLNKRARWSDGKSITAEDVKWTFDAIMDPGNLTGVHKLALERFEPPAVLDTYQIRFTAKEVHWRNLNAVGGLEILPKHAFGDKNFNKINFEFPVVSGPYRLAEVRENVYVKLERRSDWWDLDARRNRGTGNFQTLKFKYFASRETAFEVFKKGEIDLYPIYTARLWVHETTGEKFRNNWIAKQKVFNSSPVGFQGFVMNMRQAPFDDVRVRRAMAHLVDREKMNSTLMYNQYFMHRSYYEDLYSKRTPCPNEIIRFDKDRARALLAQADWKANSETGFLEKGGKPLAFKFLTRDASTDKFLTIFSEDLKDVGIRLSIERKDWAAWVKDMDEFNFDMTWASWGAGVFKDPEGMWSSKEASRKGGNNYAGFKNRRVDELIEKQKAIFDVEKRHTIVREIDRIVYGECPYVMLWNINCARLLYWNKFGRPCTVLSKYGRETSAYWYWWFDEDSVADLREAMQQGKALPKMPVTVVFDEVFGQSQAGH